jgi:thiol-disulfide isomerase/thioredoxin
MGRPALAATLAATFAAAAISCAGPRESGRESPLLGRTVSLQASRLDGRAERVPSPRAQATVVDFWATWCEPCRDQLPMLDRLQDEFRGQHVEVVAIAFDEDRAALEEFLARIPVGFPVLWDKGGAALAVKMEITRLPTTLLLDRDGVVRAVQPGFDKSGAAELERDLRRLLAQQDQGAPAGAS